MTGTLSVWPKAAACVYLVVAVFLVVAGCQREREADISIVASTTMIEAVVREVGGSTVTVQSLVPAGMCPGHFDIKPRQMREIEQADLFLYHGWEHWLPRVTRTVGLGTEIAGIDIEGEWMVPEVHIEAIHLVRDLMVALRPGREDYYRERALTYENSVLREARMICGDLRQYVETPVICSELQADLMTWVGFDVLETYGRAESMSPKTIENLIRVGELHSVRLVVDNKQSGASVGSGIADEIGAEHVVLTNFPMDGSYLDALRSNVEKLKNGLE
jgi:ABC-type Zn uptake system ZnuABC Zn-binding protein ZnuA